MSRPQFPDPLGVRRPLQPGATTSRSGLTLEERIEALERGAKHRQLPTKAGIPSDADYTVAPPVGFEVIDTTNNRRYVRMGGGSWKYSTLT